ncbi:MAG: F0F1 ATP synthase subunit B [Thermodesulfobacteriota bacterium]
MNSVMISLIVAGATEGTGHGFNWTFVTEHAVNFVILVAVLAYFLKEPIRNFLIERRGIIGNEIEEAKKAIDEAKKRYEEYAEKMRKMGEEIKSLSETIRKEGQVEREEILRQAEVTSQRIREEARETIKLETAKARREIQSEVVSLAIGLAESIIKQNLEETDERRLVEEFIKKVEEEKKWDQSRH